MWKDEEPFELELFNNYFHNLHMKEMEKQIIHNFGEVTVYCFEEKKVRDPRTLKLTSHQVVEGFSLMSASSQSQY